MADVRQATQDYVLWLYGLSVAGLSRPLARRCASEERAIAGARSWLEVLDAGGTARSFEQAAPLLQGALTSEQWDRAVEAVRAPLGRCLARTLRSRKLVDSLARGPSGPFAVIQFETDFECRQDTVETVVSAVGGDGRWRVAGYLIA